ncbi:Protein of unknown function DUF3048, N-terminal [Acidimicrobiia bacterium]
MNRRRIAIISGAVAVVVIGAAIGFITLSGSENAEPSEPAITTTTTTAPLPVWPLTGLPDAAASTSGNHPAIVVKMDNSQDARPQVGINQADIVYELLVEGITRFALVYHSDLVDPVGPVRSARSSDVDLVANLSKPLFAWSGGNAGVTAEIAAADRKGMLTDSSYNIASAAYYRSNERFAPHNLFLHLPQLLGLKAPSGQGAPAPIFTYLAKDAVFAGLPVPGMSVDFGGGTVIDYVWDPTKKGWNRFQIDGAHPRANSATVDDKGIQVAPANVVILFTEYGVSPADSRSPMALTVGSGAAIVLSDGKIVAGRWSRPNPASPAVLTDSLGVPINLVRGRTWVELPRPDSPVFPIDQIGADALLALRK